MEFFLLIICGIVAWCLLHRILQLGKPGFKTWPLVGAIPETLGNYERMYEWILWNMEQAQSSTVPIPMLGRTYVYTADPCNVEHVLKSNFPNYPKGQFFIEKFDCLFGKGIFNADGQPWKLQRKTASLEFASSILREFSTHMFKEYAIKLADLIAKISESGVTFDIQDLLMRMTLDSICKIGFGVEINVLSASLPENEFAKAFDKCNEICSYRFADPLWKLKRFLGVGREGQMDSYARIMDSFSYEIIQARRSQLLRENNLKKNCDILSRFMSLDLGLSDADLRDIVLNFVIAGRDTTAATLSWLVYMLATHPRVARKLHEDLVAFDESGDSGSTRQEHIRRFSELLNYESVSKLPYLHAALMETLRLHPPVAANFKSVLQEDVLPDGTKVKSGDLICYAPWCMGRLESLWGPDAREFRPERWCKNGVWDFNVSLFKFTAFQAGPRVCLGKDSAFLQMKITAAMLFRFFSFEMAPEQETVKYRVMATMAVLNGLRVSSTINS